MYVRLEVNAGARTDHIKRLGADRFAVAVKEPAVRQLANNRALELLAGHLKLEPKQLRIISGHFHPHKLVHIRK